MSITAKMICNPGAGKFRINGSSFSGTIESAKMNPYQAELLLKDMNISDIERFLRKNKLNNINNINK